MAQAPQSQRRPAGPLREFIESSASGGIILMGAALLALIVANSPWASVYFSLLGAYLGPLSVLHWINDALMAIFFLFVGLEIKREVLEGELATWDRRILPGVAAAGGMAAPAVIFLILNWSTPQNLRGWAIPAATDIAFALGVVALLGARVASTLKIFLTALAIIDDLGAVVIIALFYTGALSTANLGAAALVAIILFGMNRFGVSRLWPYLILGVALWVFVLRSGVHATVAGVFLAFTIPLRSTPIHPGAATYSPLHILEHGLHKWVNFLVIPIFGFANAGVSFAGLTANTLFDSLTIGIVLGLVIGKLIGVFGSAYMAIRFGFAKAPAGASTVQLLGISLLCGIGFTMSLFIGMLAFTTDPLLQSEVKIGILVGSLLAGVSGWAVLRAAPLRHSAPIATVGTLEDE